MAADTLPFPEVRLELCRQSALSSIVSSSIDDVSLLCGVCLMRTHSQLTSACSSSSFQYAKSTSSAHISSKRTEYQSQNGDVQHGFKHARHDNDWVRAFKHGKCTRSALHRRPPHGKRICTDGFSDGFTRRHGTTDHLQLLRDEILVWRCRGYRSCNTVKYLPAY